MRVLILVNAYCQNPTNLHQSVRLREEFAARGVETDVLPNNFFAAHLTEDGQIALSLRQYDFCVYLDKDKYISALLEKAGLRLYNSHDAIRKCDDKMDTAVALANCGIPMPETLPGLLCYTPGAPLCKEALDKVEGALGYPLIVKECYGSLGEQVYKATDRSSLEQIAAAVQHKPHLFQKYIAESAGRDIRVILIGGKVRAAMLRESGGDFRSNLERGGKATAIPLSELPADVRDMTERAARVLGLAYCGADVLIGENGKHYLCEVNSNAFFGGIERVTGVNIAGTYADHLLGL